MDLGSILQYRLIALPLLASYVFLAQPAFGQTSTSDSTGGKPVASQPTVADSASAPAPVDTPTVTPGPVSPADSLGSPSDSSRPTKGDSTAARADSTRPGSDTARKASARDSTKSATTVPPAPADSLLTAACRGGGSTRIAEDLLVVLFAPDVGSRERAAIAKSVKGKLMSSPEPGVYYVRLPKGGGEAGLRAAADQLSQRAEVRQVGSRACPPPSAGTSR